jgi:hypothetical protein
MYRKEVTELTTLLREDPEWDELRRLLRRRRMSPAEVLLAAFTEDGDGMEYGALVTPDRRVIEYHRRIGLHRSGPRVLVWRDRTTDPAVAAEIPQVPVALEMLGPN